MKYLGLIFVFASCSGVGIVKSLEYTRSRDELYAFILFVQFIKREVSFFLTRQKDIFMRFENKTLEKLGFLESLRSRDIDDEKSPLYYVLHDFENRLSICDEAKNILFEFADGFGRISTDEQSEKCTAVITALDEIYKKTKEEASSGVKLCRTVGCVVGALAVLLLM
ncbi:MAG: stage III sporulation protein AB [Clostridia bacterium]|nr:stage III sporulation protein AB [Clostridia bacterium]